MLSVAWWIGCWMLDLMSDFGLDVGLDVRRWLLECILQVGVLNEC